LLAIKLSTIFSLKGS